MENDDRELAQSMHLPKNPLSGGNHPLYAFDRSVEERLSRSESDRLYGGLTAEEIIFRAAEPVAFYAKHGRNGTLSWEDQMEANRQKYLPPSLRHKSYPLTPARRSQLKQVGEEEARWPRGGHPHIPSPSIDPEYSSSDEGKVITPEQWQSVKEYRDILRHREELAERDYEGANSNRPLWNLLRSARDMTGYNRETTWRHQPDSPYRRVPYSDWPPGRWVRDDSPKSRRLIELYEKSVEKEKKPIPPYYELVS